MMDGSKKCYGCQEVKPFSRFCKNKSLKDGLNKYCRDCAKIQGDIRRARPGHREQHNAYQSDWRKNNKDKFKNIVIKSNYGLDYGEYKEMYMAQNGRCAICNIHQSELDRNLAIDHCHKTKKIRGLLCTRCNVGLGFFRDSVTNIENALIYLKKQ